MATKAQAVRELKKRGMILDDYAGKQIDQSWNAIIDLEGRKSFSGSCTGIVVFQFSDKVASEFWDEVIEEAKEHAPYIEDCPHPVGQCEFHD